MPKKYHKNKSKKNITKFQKTVIYFMIYAFLGWIAEEIFCLISTHTFVKRGFLFGPICPIYGYGAIILIIFFKNYKKKPIQLFFLSAVVFSFFEYITDFFLQALFGIRWWNYTGYFLNLNSRITLSFSLIWGIGSILFIKYLHPFVTKIVGKILKKIPVKIQSISINILLALHILDTLASTIFYLGIF